MPRKRIRLPDPEAHQALSHLSPEDQVILQGVVRRKLMEAMEPDKILAPRLSQKEQAALKRFGHYLGPEAR